MSKSEDEKYMRRALELADLAQGRTSPNPLVGAVVVREGRIVGEGYHYQAGTPHAEVHALHQAGELARGAEVIVNLEPCSHHGRTPPCSRTLIAAGVKRVVMAVLDPNPAVSGRGLKMLQEAGVETRTGILQAEAEKLNEVFFKYIRYKLPFVTVKMALTLDGKIATRTGDSKWITGPESRRMVHVLRDRHDAILVGIGTVLADDPWLNTRLDKPDIKHPVRIIIDGSLKLPLTSRIVATAGQQRTIVFTSCAADPDKAQALRARNLEIITLDNDPHRVSLREVLEILGQQEICSVLVEGGAEINGDLFANRLVDKVYGFIAPKIIGGRDALSPVGGVGPEQMSEAVQLRDIKVEQIAEDILITGYPRW